MPKLVEKQRTEGNPKLKSNPFIMRRTRDPKAWIILKQENKH